MTRGWWGGGGGGGGGGIWESMGIKPAQAQADPGGENSDVTERISVLKADITTEYTSAGPFPRHSRAFAGPELWPLGPLSNVHFSATKKLVGPLKTHKKLKER